MSFSFRIFVLPWLWLIASLPFPILYGFSNFLFFVLYRVIGYRKKIVRANLTNSFPEKTAGERASIEKKFYKHLADLMLETIKGMKISASELKRRMVLQNPEVMQELMQKNQSSIIVMSHNGNWEWVCSVAQITIDQNANCVYKTLKNRNWDAWFLQVRSKFGTQPFPMEKTLRVMTTNSHLVTATAFIGDQNPSNGKNAYWTTFLHQDTCFMNGIEKIARKFNLPVLYLTVRKASRGKYTCRLHYISQNSSSTIEGEITEAVARATEADIVEQPYCWLWSHRRWKHKRESA